MSQLTSPSSSCWRHWMRFNLLYLLSRTPWDTGTTPPEVAALVEEGGLSPGRALDLGCGTGTNCIYLACHGWETVGVDFSAIAIRRARRKARRAGVNCRFHRADVTMEAIRRGTGPAGAARWSLSALCLYRPDGPFCPSRYSPRGGSSPVHPRLRRGTAGGRG